MNMLVTEFDHSDLEAEFCKVGFLAALTGELEAVCQTWLDQVIAQNQIPINEQFVAQRAAHNRELYAAGGSPPNAQVWNEFQNRPLKGAKGKTIYKALKNKVPGRAFNDQSIVTLTNFPELCGSLRANLEDLLG